MCEKAITKNHEERPLGWYRRIDPNASILERKLWCQI